MTVGPDARGCRVVSPEEAAVLREQQISRLNRVRPTLPHGGHVRISQREQERRVIVAELESGILRAVGKVMDAHGELPYGEILTALTNVTARCAGHLFRAELDEAEEGNAKEVT